MHADQMLLVRQKHEGEQPKSWTASDTHYAKARFIAGTAWAIIKFDADPVFDQCDLSFQEHLIAEVETQMAGNAPSEGSKTGEVIAKLLAELTEEDFKR